MINSAGEELAMQSHAADVRTYIDEAPEERKAVLKKLRAACREILQGYEEAMEYGMPAYKRNGVLEVSFASQKQYVSLYVLKKDVLDEHRAALAGCSVGKGCIRFKNAAAVDFNVVRSLLRRTVELETTPC
jgi:uncharacterized protein YdhG (YjbR/CyaY superfamily)